MRGYLYVLDCDYMKQVYDCHRAHKFLGIVGTGLLVRAIKVAQNLKAEVVHR